MCFGSSGLDFLDSQVYFSKCNLKAFLFCQKERLPFLFFFFYIISHYQIYIWIWSIAAYYSPLLKHVKQCCALGGLDPDRTKCNT